MIKWLTNNRRLLLRLVGTIMAIVLIVVLVRGEAWSEVLGALKQLSWARVATALALVVVSRLFVAARWYVLLRSGGVGISVRRAVALTFTGLFSNNFLPTTIGGDVVRLAGAMQLGYDRAVCLASIAADRLIGMLGMLFTLPLGLIPTLQDLGPGVAQAWTLGGLVERGITFARRTLLTFSIWFEHPFALLAALSCTWGHMASTFATMYILIQALGGHVSLELDCRIVECGLFRHSRANLDQWLRSAGTLIDIPVLDYCRIEHAHQLDRGRSYEDAVCGGQPCRSHLPARDPGDRGRPRTGRGTSRLGFLSGRRTRSMMKKANRIGSFVRTYFAVGAAICLLAIIQTQVQTQALQKLRTRYKWALLMVLFAVNLGVGLYIAARKPRTTSRWELPVAAQLNRAVALIAGVVLIVLPVPVFLLARQDFFGRGLEGFFRLLWLFWWLVLAQAAGIRMTAGWGWERAMAAAMLVSGVAAELFTLGTGSQCLSVFDRVVGGKPLLLRLSGLLQDLLR